jgi:hypothetical protein
MSKPTQIAGNVFEGGTVQINSGALMAIRGNRIGAGDGDSVQLHEVGGGWVIADDGGWVDGSFDSAETARAAAAIAYEPETAAAYAEMQKRVNHFDRENRLITQADLDSVRAES